MECMYSATVSRTSLVCFFFLPPPYHGTPDGLTDSLSGSSWSAFISANFSSYRIYVQMPCKTSSLS